MTQDLLSRPERKAQDMPNAPESSSWIIVSQVKSNRVVYFTDDPEYQPATDGDWYYCSSFVGTLPESMTLRNCWGWRFNGGVFSDAREKPVKSTQEALLESNRKALLRILREKIDLVRAPFTADCVQGEFLRQQKLVEAKQYLSLAEDRDAKALENAFPLLLTLSVARNISQLEAAKLVIAKAEEAQSVLHESERFREQFKQAILAARNPAQLLELREWLLDEVYPALSERFKYHIQNTEPIDLDRPVTEVHRLHEAARLKAQLREAINRRRASIHSGYVRNDEMRKHKTQLARAVLANAGRAPQATDVGPLQAYATARGIELSEAARRILASVASEAVLLAETEKIKDQILARIDEAETLRDIRRVSEVLKAVDREEASAETSA